MDSADVALTASLFRGAVTFTGLDTVDDILNRKVSVTYNVDKDGVALAHHTDNLRVTGGEGTAETPYLYAVRNSNVFGYGTSQNLFADNTLVDSADVALTASLFRGAVTFTGLDTVDDILNRKVSVTYNVDKDGVALAHHTDNLRVTGGEGTALDPYLYSVRNSNVFGYGTSQNLFADNTLVDSADVALTASLFRGAVTFTGLDTVDDNLNRKVSVTYNVDKDGVALAHHTDNLRVTGGEGTALDPYLYSVRNSNVFGYGTSQNLFADNTLVDSADVALTASLFRGAVTFTGLDTVRRHS